LMNGFVGGFDEQGMGFGAFSAGVFLKFTRSFLYAIRFLPMIFCFLAVR
jgi:hypothetical protein